MTSPTRKPARTSRRRTGRSRSRLRLGNPGPCGSSTACGGSRSAWWRTRRAAGSRAVRVVRGGLGLLRRNRHVRRAPRRARAGHGRRRPGARWFEVAIGGPTCVPAGQRAGERARAPLIGLQTRCAGPKPGSPPPGRGRRSCWSTGRSRCSRDARPGRRRRQALPAQYLEPDEAPLSAGSRPGQRTPVFGLGSPTDRSSATPGTRGSCRGGRRGTTTRASCGARSRPGSELAGCGRRGRPGVGAAAPVRRPAATRARRRTSSRSAGSRPGSATASGDAAVIRRALIERLAREVTA